MPSRIGSTAGLFIHRSTSAGVRGNLRYSDQATGFGVVGAGQAIGIYAQPKAGRMSAVGMPTTADRCPRCGNIAVMVCDRCALNHDPSHQAALVSTIPNGRCFRLSPRTSKIALDALLAGTTHAEAATAAGVARETVSRWITQHRAFQAALNRRRAALAAEHADVLRRLTSEALA